MDDQEGQFNSLLDRGQCKVDRVLVRIFVKTAAKWYELTKPEALYIVQ